MSQSWNIHDRNHKTSQENPLMRQFNLAEFIEFVLSHISSQKHATDRVKLG
jgi:hypothetical protein